MNAERTPDLERIADLEFVHNLCTAALDGRMPEKETLQALKIWSGTNLGIEQEIAEDFKESQAKFAREYSSAALSKPKDLK